MSTQTTIKKYLSDDGFLRASVVIGTTLVETMRTTLQSYPIATVAGGRTLLASGLMASHLKDGNVGIQFKGNGPLGTVYAETQASGAARAYVANPGVDLPTVNGQWDISTGIGRGILEVLRSTPFQTSNQVGKVEIQTGQVGEDVAFYLQQSQQIPAMINLSVEVGTYSEVIGAGGVLIELMPGHGSALIDQLERNVRTSPAISHLIQAGAEESDLLAPYLRGIPFKPLDMEFSLRYECRCTRDKVMDSLTFLSPETLDEMIKEKKNAEVRCEFCGKVYEVEIDELQEAKSRSYKKSLN
ncbi:MAG: Hsp33 family molecular chaperone HslO [Bdellovibrionales bacterium]|nr:Hsp33 family molecular chaperone HslO [Bdellovibrionales bacterium]